MKQTFKELLEEGQRRLIRSNVDEASFNALCICAEILKCRNSQIPLFYSKEASEKEQNTFLEMIQRRCSKEPLQYIIGNWSFMDFDVKVGPEALIPRPETEEVFCAAEQLIEEKILPKFGSDFSFADVGTGTGILGIATARRFPNSNGYLTDLSEDTLNLAKKNAADLISKTSKISFIQGDLLKPFNNHSLEVIISNPPYIKSEDIPGLMPEVSLFEPHLALDGGKSGLILIAKLINQAEKVLKPGGLLIFEHGHGQQEEILKLFAPDIWEIPVGQKDLCGNERYVYSFKR